MTREDAQELIDDLLEAHSVLLTRNPDSDEYRKAVREHEERLIEHLMFGN